MGGEAADRRRVVVTGLGAVSAVGWGVAALWTGLRSGHTAIGPFTRFDHTRHRTHVAGEVPEGPPAGFARGPRWNRLSLADRFALFAAREALAQAGLEPPLAERAAGVFFGSSTGGMLEGERYVADLLAAEARPRARLMASHQLNGPGDAVARALGITGPVQTLSSACASGALALEAAMSAIRAGELDVVVAGGSDSLCQITYAGFNALRAVDESPCRPFREGRAGMSLGEGAGVMILESLEHARARGAAVLAELCGAGASCDASHMTAPHPEGAGAALALSRALADADVASEAIAFVNAHGTGTALNDVAEFAALAAALGPRAREVPVTSTKGVVGHLLGSSGALEAVATVLCLREREVHPTPGGGRVDPAIPVRLVLDAPQAIPDAEAAVSTSLAFGGSNVALVLGRWGT
jgi:3-oxoacyl-[acyl-carrier-protein] synthase II